MQFAHMVIDVHMTHEAMKEQEIKAPYRQFQRSLYAVKDIKEGERYSLENIRSIRPGYGLPPGMLPRLIGRKAKRDFRRGEPLS